MAAVRGAALRADLARYYDLDLVDDPGDVEMYLAFAAGAGGPILELAAGSGRVCVALAAAGHDVTGVDNDEAMLDRARAAWNERREPAGGGSLTLVEHDLTTVALERRFKLVILALNSLLLLADAEAQQAALRTMAAHLEPDGRAVIDVWLPAPEDLQLYDGRLMLDWVRRDETTREMVAKSWSAHYGSALETAQVTTFFDAWQDGHAETVRRSARIDDVRFVRVAELSAMVAAAGMTSLTMAGDYAMTHLAPDSERVVLMARPATR